MWGCICFNSCKNGLTSNHSKPQRNPFLRTSRKSFQDSFELSGCEICWKATALYSKVRSFPVGVRAYLLCNLLPRKKDTLAHMGLVNIAWTQNWGWLYWLLAVRKSAGWTPLHQDRTEIAATYRYSVRAIPPTCKYWILDLMYHWTRPLFSTMNLDM